MDDLIYSLSISLFLATAILNLLSTMCFWDRIKAILRDYGWKLGVLEGAGAVLFPDSDKWQKARRLLDETYDTTPGIKWRTVRSTPPWAFSVATPNPEEPRC